MITKRNSSGKATCISHGLALGLVYGIAVTLLTSLIISFLISSEKMTWDNIGYGIMILVYLSSLISAKVACQKVRYKKATICVASAILYQLFLLTITMLFFGGHYYAIVPTMLMIIAGAGTAFFMGKTKSEHTCYRKKKYHAR